MRGYRHCHSQHIWILSAVVRLVAGGSTNFKVASLLIPWNIIFLVSDVHLRILADICGRSVSHWHHRQDLVPFNQVTRERTDDASRSGLKLIRSWKAGILGQKKSSQIYCTVSRPLYFSVVGWGDLLRLLPMSLRNIVSLTKLLHVHWH